MGNWPCFNFIIRVIYYEQFPFAGILKNKRLKFFQLRSEIKVNQYTAVKDVILTVHVEKYHVCALSLTLYSSII